MIQNALTNVSFSKYFPAVIPQSGTEWCHPLSDPSQVCGRALDCKWHRCQMH